MPTKERLRLGEYLANHVAVCMDCHSARDWIVFSGPLVSNTLGMGGEVFDQKFGFPGSYVERNITPYGIGAMTDGELLRAITTGVDRNGDPLSTGGTVRSANIIPDEETGIGSWTEESFVDKFKSYSDSLNVPTKIGKGEFYIWMPWTMYGKMTREDLSVIYTYMQTVKPVKNLVERFDSN